MCLSVFLLADRPLPVPPDPAVYPGLRFDPVEEEHQSQTISGIRQVARAALVYQVTPGGYCGCYFEYQTPEQFQEHLADRDANPNLQYANTREDAEIMWQTQVDAVRSFGRYLAAHSDASLDVYTVWEHCAGQRSPRRATVPPSYFGGPGFSQLPEDVLLTITQESPSTGTPLWDPAANRTHEWLGCDQGCPANADDTVG